MLGAGQETCCIDALIGLTESLYSRRSDPVIPSVRCPPLGLIHTGRATRRVGKLERFSFDVAYEQCEHSH